MHIHGVFFQVLDRQPFLVNGDEIVLQGELERPSRGERAWKDTVRVGPFETVRIITRFDDHEGRFPFHCHLLEHEDHGMMRQYEAVAVCGDGARARGHEECDDGNTRDGDGCDEDCAIEGRGSAAGGGGEGTGPAEGGEGGRPPVASGGEGGHDSIGGAAGALDATLSPKAPDAAGCSCRVSRSAESVAHEWLFAALALLSVSRAARRAWPSRA
jgi:cysteine-rich repeat protein